MAKVEHTSDARVLVGIDISKHRHEVLIAIPGKTRRRRIRITNSTDDFMRLIGMLREYGMPVWIGFEATGNYHRLCCTNGLMAVVPLSPDRLIPQRP